MMRNTFVHSQYGPLRYETCLSLASLHAPRSAKPRDGLSLISTSILGRGWVLVTPRDVRCGSFASVWPRTDDFRSTSINRHRYRASAGLKCPEPEVAMIRQRCGVGSGRKTTGSFPGTGAKIVRMFYNSGRQPEAARLLTGISARPCSVS